MPCPLPHASACSGSVTPVPGPTRMSGVAGDLGIRMVPRSVHTATRTCRGTGRRDGQMERHAAVCFKRHGHLKMLHRAPRAVDNWTCRSKAPVRFIPYCALLSGLLTAK